MKSKREKKKEKSRTNSANQARAATSCDEADALLLLLLLLPVGVVDVGSPPHSSRDWKTITKINEMDKEYQATKQKRNGLL